MWGAEACPEGWSCEAETGECLRCTPGAAVGCDGDIIRLVCNGDGSEVLNEPCPGLDLCEEGACVPSDAACATDDACGNDQWCAAGVCTPWADGGRGEFNESCKRRPLVGPLEPVVQCRWDRGEVTMQPVVADLDGDEVPEIAFIGTNSGAAGSLIAIRGDDCSEVFRSAEGGLLNGTSGMAAGDIDNDGVVELVALDLFGTVTAFEGAHKAWSAVTNGGGIATAPVIADLDGDGMVEVIVGTTILNGLDGSVRARGPAPPSFGFGPLPAVADLDGDGAQEIVFGNQLINIAGQSIAPAGMLALPAGHVAVADLDLNVDGPELAVVTGRTSVRMQHLDGTVFFGPFTVPSSMWAGGAPNVADFDGDGFPEVGTAGSNNYAVFDRDCDAEPVPAFCAARGIRWLSPSRDTSSGSTGSTTFDFEGDGRVEVIYNDECFLRVYDGTTGAVLFALANSSGTLIEAPLVADVDGDFSSEIVAVSDRGFGCSEPDPTTGTPAANTQGVTVLRDITDRWAHSRPIWNQNAYHITNVLDDGSIPMHEAPSWERFNSYRQNRQADGKDLDAADITVVAPALTTAACGGVELRATVHNRGAQPVSRGVPVLFFTGNPDRGGELICQAATTTRLGPGEGEEVGCTWRGVTGEASTVWVVADSTFEGGGLVNQNSECLDLNNWATLAVPGCSP